MAKGKRIGLVVLVMVGLSQIAFGATARKLIDQGREKLFNGSLSGIRESYVLFKDARTNPDCEECQDHPELIFFESVSHALDLIVRDDGGISDSVLELARRFGVDVFGDQFNPLELDVEVLLNDSGEYMIPDTAPDETEMRDILDTTIIPELQEILDGLEMITDTPEEPFVVWLYPEETGLKRRVEVDYSDVQVLKAMIAMIKGLAEAEEAWDLYTDTDDTLMLPKIYNNAFDINADLLDVYPEFLTVAPTSNNPADGKALLAQGKLDIIDGINYYLDVFDMIRNETDDQVDDLLAVDLADLEAIDALHSNLITFRDSLVNDTELDFVTEAKRTYDVFDYQGDLFGQIDLNLNPISDETENSYITLQDRAGLDYVWRMDGGIKYGNAEFWIDLLDGPHYNGNYNMNHKNSLLFTPTNDNYYHCDILEESLFSETGVAQNWHYATSFLYTLPFSFNFYGTMYDSVYITPYGFIDFQSSSTPTNLSWSRIRISPLASPAGTYNPGFDIFIDTSVEGKLTIRWKRNYNGYEFNHSVTLFEDGRIRFDYGYCEITIYNYIGIAGGLYDNYLPVGSRWGYGVMTASLNDDKSELYGIKINVFEPMDYTIANLSALQTDYQESHEVFDLNPIFGSSARYPDPLNPRDLLPQFDQWMGVAKNSVGQGMIDKGATPDEAATLGGMLPGKTQEWWNDIIDPQPQGEINLSELSEGQITVDGDVSDWTDDQLVLDDIRDIFEYECDIIDIDKVYLGIRDNQIYGAITLHDYSDYEYKNENPFREIYFSYSAVNPEIKSSYKIMFDPYGGYLMWYDPFRDNGWSDGWEETGSRGPVGYGEDIIEFGPIPLNDEEGDNPGDVSLMGRFISVDGSIRFDFVPDLHNKTSADKNHTHLQITQVGGVGQYSSITGEVYALEGYEGPYTVRLFTDTRNIEGSTIYSMVMDEAGVFTFDDVPVGFTGYIQASEPLYGFNLFAPDAETLYSNLESVTVVAPGVSGFELTFTETNDYCSMAIELTEGVMYTGTFEDATGEDITSCRCSDDVDVWHTFTPDADGVYVFWIEGSGATANVAVFDHCYGDEMLCTRGCDEYGLISLKAGQTYAVRVGAASWDITDATYGILVEYYSDAAVNDYCTDAIPVSLGLLVDGSTENATGMRTIEYGEWDYEDTYNDVWYSFTPTVDGVYQLNFFDIDDGLVYEIYSDCDDDDFIASYNDYYSEWMNLAWRGQAGKTYLIRIAGQYDDSYLDYTFTILQASNVPVNDLCEDAIDIVADEEVYGRTVNATGVDLTDRVCGDRKDVWYNFNPTVSGVYKMEIESDDPDYDFEPTVSLFDSCGSDPYYVHRPCLEYLAVSMQAGVDHKIRISGKDGSYGEFVFILTKIAEPIVNDFWYNAIDMELDEVYAGTTYGATGEDMTNRICEDIYDVWYRFVPDYTERYHIEVADEGDDMRYSVHEFSWPAFKNSFSEIIADTCDDPDSFLGIQGRVYYIRLAARYVEQVDYSVSIHSSRLMGDVYEDGVVNFMDYSGMANQWMMGDCENSFWCYGADLNHSGDVDLDDVIEFAIAWMSEARSINE